MRTPGVGRRRTLLTGILHHQRDNPVLGNDDERSAITPTDSTPLIVVLGRHILIGLVTCIEPWRRNGGCGEKSLEMQLTVPFSKPFLTGKELTYIAQVVAAGAIGSNGYFTYACAQLLERRFGIPRVFLVPSCTAALEMAALLCGLEPGDEVILPSFTFASTANAFVRLGAKPAFVDIRPDTLNLDEHQVDKRISRRTKAIFAVHYAGVSCDMNALRRIAHEHNLLLVEDAAQGVNAFYNGHALGSMGDLGAYSFHSTKNYSCGEGGALCINSPQFAERAEVLREKGTDRSRFLRGEVDRYTWVDVGSSYVPTELACAYLYAQLEAMDSIRERHAAVFQRYQIQLLQLQLDGLVRLPQLPRECLSNFHMFYLLLPDGETRANLQRHLAADRIQSSIHYVPLHCSKMGRAFRYREGDFPVTEQVSASLLRLPFYAGMTEEEQMAVIASIGTYFKGSRTRWRRLKDAITAKSSP